MIFDVVDTTRYSYMLVKLYRKILLMHKLLLMAILC